MARKRHFATSIAVFCLAVLSGCQTPEKQKVLYIDSYHPSDATTDATLAGIYEVVADSKARLDVCFLDAKRFPQPEAVEARVQEVLETIGDVQPQVIITSGDAAASFVLAAHLKAGPVPVVFCDIDWACDPYGLPTENVTGIVAIPPVGEAIAALHQVAPDLRRVTVLSVGTVWRPDHRAAWDRAFAQAQVTPTYVSVATYEQWKTQFVQANDSGEAIFLQSRLGVADWDETDAEAFVAEQIRVPVVTCDASMMRYAVLGVAADGRMQGQWAAQTALRLLNSKEPADVPVARTQATTAYLNPKLAKRIGFEPDEALGCKCHRVE